MLLGKLQTPIFLLLIAGTMLAAPLQPTDISVALLPGGTDTNSPFTDDLILDSITFGGTEVDVQAQSWSTIEEAIVQSGFAYVNAEFGDNDTGADGNPNPFVAAGIIGEDDPLPLSTQESTNPAIQNPAIAAAFNSRSLTSMIDGENKKYVVDLYFADSISDGTLGKDAFPELIFYERGINSDFSVELILGGSKDNPLLSAKVTITRKQLWDSGIYVDTTEAGKQKLGFIGIDLAEFGIGLQEVMGVRITSENNTGADLGAMFAGNPRFLTSVPGQDVSETPEPGTFLLLGLGLICFGLIRYRTREARQQ
jgi:hypothetical protein